MKVQGVLLVLTIVFAFAASATIENGSRDVQESGKAPRKLKKSRLILGTLTLLVLKKLGFLKLMKVGLKLLFIPSYMLITLLAASRRIFKGLYRLLLPIALILKIKVVLLSIGLILAVAYIYKLYYAYALTTQPFVFNGRSADNTFDITERIMKGLDMAELSYRAFNENDGKECRARLACEARQLSKENSMMARVINIFSSSVTEFDSGRDSACEQLGCTLTYNSGGTGSSITRRR